MYYGWEKENAYLSGSCILWATVTLVGNTGAVLSCGGACGNPFTQALTIGQACVGCLAAWAALNGSAALAFESVCTRQTCKFKGKAKFTEYLMTCE